MAATYFKNFRLEMKFDDMVVPLLNASLSYGDVNIDKTRQFTLIEVVAMSHLKVKV